MEARQALEALNAARIQYRGTFEDHVKLQQAVDLLRQMIETQPVQEPEKVIEPEVITQ